MGSKDWGETFRILKSKGISAGDVAKAFSLSEGYISRMKKKKESFTKENFDLFNKLYGKWVTLDRSMIYKMPAKSKVPIENDVYKTVQDLRTRIDALQVYLLRYVVKAGRGSREQVLVEMHKILEEVRTGVSSPDIPND